MGRARDAKQALRERMWSLLERRRVAAFPLPLADRIPNFTGAARAAARLAEAPEWKRARRIKCNPDAPQRPVRLRALQEGKEVLVAVPRLRARRCFLRLDPRTLRGRLAEAATIGGAARLGKPIEPDDLGCLDLIVAGSVAVNRQGARLGKGGGYSDLEYALARQVGAADARTPVVTTVHDLQVVNGRVPMTAHDVPLDIIVTPTRVIRPRRAGARPVGIRWDELSAEQLDAMPAVASLREGPVVRRRR